MESAVEELSLPSGKKKYVNNHGYYCCVPLCKSRSKIDTSLSFHSFPTAKSREDVRRAWIHAIRREEGKHFKVTRNTRVCSAHFMPDDYSTSVYAGTVAAGRAKRNLLEKAVPSVFDWKNPVKVKRKAPLDRSSTPAPKAKRRRSSSVDLEEVPELLNEGEEQVLESARPEARSSATSSPGTSRTQNVWVEHDYPAWLPGGTPLPPGVLAHIQKLKKENKSLKKDMESLRKKTISIQSLKSDDEDFCACTGLPSYGVFKELCEYLKPKARRLQRWRGKETIKKCTRPTHKRRLNTDRTYQRTITIEEEFFAVLFRLRTATPIRIAAKLLGVTRAEFSRLFTTWINFLAYELEQLTRLTTAEPATRGAAAFRKFPNTRMVVDCTEVFAQRPSGLKARQQMFSPYKHHITIKFLVGCNTNGSVCFVSSAWGGRASDKKITCEECLQTLKPGEAVMADRGFLVEEEVAARGCRLHIPAFLTASRAQLTASEVTATRRIARARIHIERAIQRIKLFRILQLIPLSLLHVSEQIFKVCAYLTNFQKPIIANIVDLKLEEDFFSPSFPKAELNYLHMCISGFCCSSKE